MKRAFFLATLMMLLLLPVVGWATDWYCTSETAFINALSSAVSGDKIIITSSWVTTQSYTIDTNNLTIQGDGTPRTITKGTDSAIFVFNGSSSGGSTLKDLTIDGNKSLYTGNVIEIFDPSCNIQNVIITNADERGILFGAGSDNSRVIDCEISNCSSHGIDIANISSIEINNCYIHNNSGCGIKAYGDRDNIVISNSQIISSGSCGINLRKSSDTATPDNCIIINNTITNWALNTDADAINCEGQSCRIENNIITQTQDNGHIAWAIETSSTSDDLIIEGNNISGSALDKAISLNSISATVQSNRIKVLNPYSSDGINTAIYQRKPESSTYFAHNLILVGTAASGEEYAIYLTTDGSTASAKFINNTIIAIEENVYCGVRLAETGSGDWPSTVAIKNNIIKGFSYGMILDDILDNGISIEHNYNCYDNNPVDLAKNVSDTLTSLTLGGNSFEQDPLLTPNYHLSANSPCINAGTFISGFHETALDIDGQPILGTPDIGCDERKALWWDGRGWHMQKLMVEHKPHNSSVQDEGTNDILDESGSNILDES